MAFIARMFQNFMPDLADAKTLRGMAFDVDTPPPEVMKPELIGGETALASLMPRLDPERAAKVDSNLKLAKDMFKRGQSNDDILARTGFYFDEYGKPKYEIDDSEADLLIPFEEIKAGQQMLLGDFLKHDKFFTFYPDLAEAPLKFYNGKSTEVGGYNLKTGEMEINLNSPTWAGGADPIDAVADLLHESQHAIQKFEKFSRGGATKEFLKGIDKPTEKRFFEAYKKYLRMAGEAEARNVAFRFSSPKKAAVAKAVGLRGVKDETAGKTPLQTLAMDPMSQKYGI